MGCRHTQHVIAVLFSRCELLDSDSYEGIGIERAILEEMSEVNCISPGWLDLPYEMPLVGTFAVYLSEQCDPQVLKVKLMN